MKHLIDVIAAGPPQPARRGLGGVRVAVRPGRRRQPAVAGRRLCRGPHLRRRHRRYPRATCSRTCPAIRRATSPSACPARWPAASAPPPTPPSPWRTPAPGTCCRRASRWCCAIGLIGTVNLPMAAGAGRRLRGHAGRADLPAGPARHAAASPLCRAAPPRVDGELVDVIGNFGVVRAFGATLREQRRLGATIGDRDGRPPRAACSIWRTCG